MGAVDVHLETAALSRLLQILNHFKPGRPALLSRMAAEQPSANVLKMREIISQHGAGGWDEAWKQGVTPWDSDDGTVRPPLKELVEDVKFPLPTSGRAIVPGCGRGYDAAYFASSLGLESWGVDISPLPSMQRRCSSRPCPTHPRTSTSRPSTSLTFHSQRTATSSRSPMITPSSALYHRICARRGASGTPRSFGREASSSPSSSLSPATGQADRPTA